MMGMLVNGSCRGRRGDSELPATLRSEHNSHHEPQKAPLFQQTHLLERLKDHAISSCWATGTAKSFTLNYNRNAWPRKKQGNVQTYQPARGGPTKTY